ncbi:MAG TPA: acyl-CoA dehydrogenase [Mycobacteriales bacterium]|jgi:alkylation response protein AidB-like acyl-CoA dehydrogenase|nr:acyl-CoA dehydrogenase [Mycobacteriales bacterium]
MPIGITEDHEALRESAREMLAKHCPPAARRAALEATGEELPAYWASAAELGWFGLHVPEEYGGAGFGLLEQAVVVEELGRSIAPGCYVPTVHAAAVIAREGGALAKGLLPGLADGSTPASVAIGAPAVEATEGPEGLTLSGVSRPVIGGALAKLVILRARVGDRIVWCAVDTDGLTVMPIDSFDATRRLAELDLTGVVVAPERQLAMDNHDVYSIGAVLYAAESCGLTGWCLDTAASYAKERVQFGRPIGMFQAIKHRAADMLVHIELTRAAVWDAARSEVHGEEGQLAVSAASSIAFDGAVDAGKDCVQMLGGIGFTWEHDAHLYLKRAITVRQLLGPMSAWRSATAQLGLNGVRRKLDVELPAEAEDYRGEVQAFLASLDGLDDETRKVAIANGGYLAPHWPVPWGKDASAVQQVVIDEEFKKAKVRRAHLSIAAWALPTIIEHGSPEQIQNYVPETFHGRISWCQLFSEPGAGSDLASLSTKAEPTEGGWLISGQKVWTSLAKQATHGILLARTSAGKDGDRHHGISYFLLDMSSPGIDIRPLRELTGAAMFNEVFLDNVFVPADCLVGEVDGGWRLARTTLANERVSMASGSAFGVGVESILRLLENRDVDQVTLDHAGHLIAEAQSLALLGMRSTMRVLTGGEKGSESSLRKLFAAEHEQRVQEFGLELLGAEGATLTGDAFMWGSGFLSTRCLTIAGGTSEVQRNVIAERLLGLPRDAG